MKNKKMVLLAAVLGAVLLTACGNKNADKPYAGQTVHVYNQGAYIGDGIIEEFENQTGCKVLYDEFEPNEQMYIKVSSGDKFDLIIPSDYMIECLIGEDRLTPLDKSKLPCMNDICDEVKNLSYDPENVYSVPYFWGTVGIAYDKTKVDKKDLEEQGFDIFKNPKYKGDIYLYDSERDSFMMALKQLGYSTNTKDESELQEAYEWLLDVVNNMDPEIVSDEVNDLMVQGKKALALVYSGDATYAEMENENLGFYMPECGTNIWIDAMVIPKNAENPELAYEFINFITGHDIAMSNALDVGYTSVNKEVYEELISEGGEFEGYDAYIPRSDNPKDEIYQYDAETRKKMASLWAKVKIAASNAN